MMPNETDRMFSFKFEKNASEIAEKAKAKTLALKAKIEERQRRIAELREAHGIDDAALVDLLTQARRNDRAVTFQYTSNAPANKKGPEERTIGAGVVNNLLTENDFIEADKASVKRLEILGRNLRPLSRITSNGTRYEENGFPLSYEELEFLGF